MAKLYPSPVWKRIVAFIIDMIIVGIAMFAAIVPFEVIDHYSTPRWLVNIIILLFLAYVIFIIPVYEGVFKGRTLGKMLMKIRVVDTEGLPPTMSQSLRRYLMWMFDFFLTFCLGAWISTLITSRRQRLGDLVAGTMVVEDTPHDSKYNDVSGIYYTELAPEEQDIFGRLNLPDTLSPSEMAHAYQALECDIARLHTINANPKLIDYAERALSAMRIKIFGHRCVTWVDSVKGTLRSIPLAIYESRMYMFASLVVALVSYAIGMYSQYADTGTFLSIFGPGYYETTIDNIESGNPMGIYGSQDEWDMFGAIFSNNFMVMLRMFVMGIIVLIGPLYFLIVNFVSFGVFDAFFAQHGEVVAALVSPNEHGVLELGSIIISGGAALRLGMGWIFPGRMTRLRALAHSARQSVQVMLSTVPMLCVAAIIESFITRHTEWPMAVKMMIIITSLLFIIIYYVMLPIVAHRR